MDVLWGGKVPGLLPWEAEWKCVCESDDEDFDLNKYFMALVLWCTYTYYFGHELLQWRL